MKYNKHVKFYQQWIASPGLIKERILWKALTTGLIYQITAKGTNIRIDQYTYTDLFVEISYKSGKVSGSVPLFRESMVFTKDFRKYVEVI